MRRSTFYSLLFLAGLLAILYSPTQLQLGGGAQPVGASPVNREWSGSSEFIALARAMGYQVLLANSSAEVFRLPTPADRVVYVLLGPDLALSSQEREVIETSFHAGRVSVLIAEGNVTNNALLGDLFALEVTGSVLIDPTSPYEDKRILPAAIRLDGDMHYIVLNVASRLRGLSLQAYLNVVGVTSSNTYEDVDRRVGSRPVAAAVQQPAGSRAFVLTDSGPFLNNMLSASSPPELRGTRAFVSALLTWLTYGDTSIPLVVDNAHYAAGAQQPSLVTPTIGSMVSAALATALESFNTQYDTVVGGLAFPLLLGSALLAVLSIYAGLRRWLGKEGVGRDDLQPPRMEAEFLVESPLKIQLRTGKRTGSFYADALARLHDVLDDLMHREFRSSLDGVLAGDYGALEAKLGSAGAQRFARHARELRRIKERVEGKRRFLFPPILRWRATFRRTIGGVDELLKSLGIYLVEEEGIRAKALEYRLRRR